MSVSEYETFGVLPNRDEQMRGFNAAMKHQLKILEHSYGPYHQAALGRHMMADFKLKEYDKTGDKSYLIEAAAWIFSEWVDR